MLVQYQIRVVVAPAEIGVRGVAVPGGDTRRVDVFFCCCGCSCLLDDARCVLQCASSPPRCRLELHACLQFSALSVRSTPPPTSLRQWGAPSCTRGPNQSGLGGGRTRFSCTPTRTPSLSSGLISRPQSSSPSRFPSPLPLRPSPSSDSAYAKSRS